MQAKAIFLNGAVQVQSNGNTSDQFFIKTEDAAPQFRNERFVKAIELGDVWVRIVSLNDEESLVPVSSVKRAVPFTPEPAPRRTKPQPSAA